MKKDYCEVLIKIIHLLLVTAFICILLSISSCSGEVEETIDYDVPVTKNIDVEKYVITEGDKKILYAECCKQIKKYESFSSERYLDNDSCLTIGYGHHIKGGEKFPMRITECQASEILEKDFDAHLGIAKKYSDDYHRQLAIGMFTFNVGEGNYKKSTLKKLVDLNLPIDYEIVKWCHFRHNGEMRRSSGLLKRRKFELSVYNIIK